MNKIFFSLALLFCICKMNAQITLEHTYPGVSQGQFTNIKLDVSGTKYMVDSSTNATFNFRIYNTDHTLFRSINFTNPYSASSNTASKFYVSEELFDSDPQIEFAVNYSPGTSGSPYRFVIYNEDGSILFNKNNANIGNAFITQSPGYSGVIPTPSGTKMILHLYNPFSYKIYSLPGSLPCWECSDGSYTGNRQTNSEDFPEGINSQIFPNPSSSQTEIAYELPDGCRQATLKVFSIEGTLLKTFTITSDFDSIVLSNEDLAAGTYFYKIETPKGELDAKKFVIVQQ